MNRSILRTARPLVSHTRLLSTMSNNYVKRTTLFKIPEEHVEAVLKQYEILRQTAVKVHERSVDS